VATEIVTTGQLRAGDVVLTHGMRVRIDEIDPYQSRHGDAWSCPGTVLNLAEVLAQKIVPPAFLTTEKREDGRGWVTGRRDYWAIQRNELARWTVAVPRPGPEAPADPEPKRGWTMDQARAAVQQVGAELQAAADAGALGFPFEDQDPELERAAITIVSEGGSQTMRAIRDGAVVAFLKWSGNILKVYIPGGTILGRLYRSDGKRQGDKITCTFRAWTVSDRLEIRPPDTEVARGASLPGAVAALLQHAAGARSQAES